MIFECETKRYNFKLLILLVNACLTLSFFGLCFSSWLGLYLLCAGQISNLQIFTSSQKVDVNP